MPEGEDVPLQQEGKPELQAKAKDHKAADKLPEAG